MSATIEQRLESVEHELAALKMQLSTSLQKPSAKPWLAPPAQKDPLAIFGCGKDDPFFEESVRLGAEWRASQTYEQEIEVRGGVGY